MDQDGEPPEVAMIYSGAVNWFAVGYGSRFDGERWLLAFCDECLEKMNPIKKDDYLLG